MNVKRMVVVNPVEPSPLSFRAPMGLETRLNVTWLTPAGNTMAVDFAAQLQLTGRSSDRTTSYLMPATDIANGRARAIIPGGDIGDPNGYRLALIGTVNGEASLIASGTVMPMPSVGFVEIPADLIDTIDLTFSYGESAELDVTLWADDGKDAPYDLTDNATTITAAVYDSKGGPMLVPFAVTVLGENKVQLSLTAAEVDALPALCWWSLVASTAAGATTLCQGTVTVSAP